MSGRVFGTCGQFGAFGGSHVSPQLNYNHRSRDVNGTRRLSHSGLGIALNYPLLPTNTTNFQWDILPRRDMTLQKTLGSTHVTLWPGIIDDIVIKEKWDAPGGLSFPWKFLVQLHRMYMQAPDWLNGESLLWCPVDRTRKVYPVDMINLLVDGEEFDVTWRGDDYAAGPGAYLCPESGSPGKDVNSASVLEVHLKLRVEGIPAIGVSLSEGASVDEHTQFESE
jgi:hypothetical protein